ncbi:MAG: leucine--tRNA ligase [Candidatus Aenigmarchaeota archaeon]|nr:leucine--tRNA ligase [Candidatus Aenigmarchaeota archaeon]
MDFKKVEKKWREKWSKSKIFETDVDQKKKKFFTSIVIPYVNGRPHIGHSFTNTRTDVYARFKRMQGFNTLLAVGFHATGEPIVGAVERLKKGDKTQIETFKMYGATDKDIKDFIVKGPKFVANYWMNKFVGDFNSMGYSVDWRRRFVTAITPSFNRFIEWQYNTLRKKGYVIQGTHPVIWCHHDQSPTGDHDRLKGEGESPTEFALMKFRLDEGEILPCATLRPETIYGVTNLWINPDAEYVGAKVGKETWIISRESVQKFRDQLKSVEVGATISGADLIGKYVTNIVTGNKIIILPGKFVDASTATGVVMSVPSHAPYDYVALKELQGNENAMKEYGLDSNVVKGIGPVSVIKLEGYGDHPAIEISEKMGIQSTAETEKLDDATSVIYKKEYHTGVLKGICGRYEGKKVSEVKDLLIKDFVNHKLADTMWETSNPVVCRCTNKCHVKILENQWFLKFSDKAWKDKVKQCIAQMKFYPEEVRLQFLNTVDWLDDKACARKSGLGTRLPWDKEWIVETLSDSVIYMAYYTIAKTINKKKIPYEKLTDDVFDYVFLGEGDIKKIGKTAKLSEMLIEEMREEFEYFYPLDMRNSAKELVPNHLTYALFHHVAIWENPRYWPKAYSVNGFVTVSGEKMSKSKGNILPLASLIEKYGADLVRITITTSNENVDDADWKEDSLKTFSSRLEYLENLVKEYKKAKRKSVNNLDKYLESVVETSIKGATENYEMLKFRSGIQYVAFQLLGEIRHYIERNGSIKNCNKILLQEAVSTAVRLLAPFTPHLGEELWEKLGNKKFVSLGPWPTYDERRIDRAIVELEQISKKLQDDLNNVLKLTGEKKNAYLYFVTDKELDYFKESVEYLRGLFNFKKLEIYKASDAKKYDPEGKASRAKYGKPAIYLE